MDSLDDERRIDRMRERARKLLDARLLREAKAAAKAIGISESEALFIGYLIEAAKRKDEAKRK